MAYQPLVALAIACIQQSFWRHLSSQGIESVLIASNFLRSKNVVFYFMKIFSSNWRHVLITVFILKGMRQQLIDFIEYSAFQFDSRQFSLFVLVQAHTQSWQRRRTIPLLGLRLAHVQFWQHFILVHLQSLSAGKWCVETAVCVCFRCNDHVYWSKLSESHRWRVVWKISRPTPIIMLSINKRKGAVYLSSSISNLINIRIKFETFF